MKKISILIILAIQVLHIANASESFSIYPDEIRGIRDVIIEIESASQKKDYEKIYDLIDPYYTDSVSKAGFSKVINKQWRIDDISLLNYQILPSAAYLVIQVNEFDGINTRSSFGVWFWKMDTDGKWAPQNFPFPGSQLPNFSKLPPCLIRGFK